MTLLRPDVHRDFGRARQGKMALQKKPPVVTIVGHVDHGKTSLLDYIRRTKVADKEFGQITQAIGAYQVEVNSQKITFIDTPGHEAFAAMRARGAKAADLVILVVSGSDGVMPQTKECIKLLLENKIPFLVAITKIDLPEFSSDRVKTQLAENQVFVEGYGGNVVAVGVSAKTGAGIDQLLEMILLVAEMADLKADPLGNFEAVVIESKADKFCGCVATLVVQNGSLHLGNKITDGKSISKVKSIKNDKGETIKEALPGQPVLLLGFSQLPEVGTIIVKTDDEVKSEVNFEKTKNIAAESEDSKKMKIILKADVFGSLEAILCCLPKEVLVIDQSVGEINESDIMLAKTFGAEIYVFNLNLGGSVEKLAKTEKVKIQTFKVIYDLLENLQKKLEKFLNPLPQRNILGKAEVLAVFDMKGQKIAGCRMLEGKINRKSPVLIQREGVELANTRIISLKQEKQDINETEQNKEFGAVFQGKVDFAPGDMVLSYSLEEN